MTDLEQTAIRHMKSRGMKEYCGSGQKRIEGGVLYTYRGRIRPGVAIRAAIIVTDEGEVRGPKIVSRQEKAKLVGKKRRRRKKDREAMGSEAQAQK